MKLKILVPDETVLDREVQKIGGEAQNGSFTLLPKHIDCVTALVPGILSYVDTQGEESFLAVDAGVLVKKGNEVLVSTRRAFESPELGKLKEVVEGMEEVTDERKQVARRALAELEINIVRRFMELGK